MEMYKETPPPYNNFNNEYSPPHHGYPPQPQGPPMHMPIPYSNAPTYNMAPQPQVVPVPIVTQPSVTNVTVNTAAQGMAGVGCPVCHNGSFTGTYSCCAWMCAIFCFPCGIICCLCMRQKKCTKCGFSTG